MIAASMDLGSNTLRLLVARARGGVIAEVLERGLAAPRLGRGLTPGGALARSARDQARQAAREFAARARALGATRVALAATQACRVAVDGSQFVSELERELGLDRAVVLSGEDEARLARLGVLARLEGQAEGALLADVGGGSTELVALGEGTAPPLSLGHSIALGAVSLTEAHLASDPPAPAELEALDRAVDKALAGLDGLAGRPARRLVVTAGTAATLASLVLGLTVYAPARIDNLRVTRQDLEQTAARLAGLPLDQRRRALKLDSARADIIIAGLAIVRGLVRIFGLHEITAMDAGLLEGILLDDLARAERGEQAHDHM